MHKFRRQLLLSYLPLAALPVLLIGFATRSATVQSLSLLVTQNGRDQMRAFAPCLEQYYATNRTWAGLQELIRQDIGTFQVVPVPGTPDDGAGDIVFMVRRFGILGCYQGSSLQPPRRPPGGGPGQGGWPGGPPNPIPGQPNPGMGMIVDPILVDPVREGVAADSVVITDMNGTVLVSSDGQNVGKQIGAEAMARSMVLRAAGQDVGRLVIGQALGALNVAQQRLLDSVNWALVISGGLAALVVVVMGMWMSWQIAAPVRELMKGVRQLAAGAWNQPLVVRSHNELGDVTAAFNQMAAEVTHQQQLMRQMMADVAHDLRTPLSVMALEVEAIEAGFQTPQQAAASLREEIAWLQRMVEDLRTMTMLDADRLRLAPESVPLGEFVRGVGDFWQTLAEDGGRCLGLDVPDNLPMALIDPGRMRQVLGNLLDNAIRHTEAGKTITLRARSGPQAFTLQVIDEGEGIHPDDLPHIFDRFYRADPARGHRRKGDSGSGLGLSIVRRLVEMHGGTIEAASTLGKGTTFTITLPHKPKR